LAFAFDAFMAIMLQGAGVLLEEKSENCQSCLDA
jgi:hypothetical protein